MKAIYFLILMVSAPSWSMSLQDVYEEALRKNESVPTQEEAVSQAEENVKQAWGSIVPNISGSSQWMWQQAVQGPNGSFSPSYNPLTKLTASQPMFQGFREWYGLDQAKKQRSQQRYLKDNVELTVYRSVVSGYYQILSLEKDILNLKDNVHYLGDELMLLQKWLKIGRAQKTAVLTAQSSIASQEVLIEQDVYQLKQARNSFSLTTGLPPDTPLDDDAAMPSSTLAPLAAYLDSAKNR